MWHAFKKKVQKLTHKFIRAGFSLGKNLKNLFTKKIDETVLDEFEKILFEADLGADMSVELKEKLKKQLQANPNLTSEEILVFLKKELLLLFPKQSSESSEKKSTLDKQASLDNKATASPRVIMLVGVNGSGKTTTLAKLAYHYQKQGKKVLIAAADTFRAAAVEQLTIWAQKIGCEIVKSHPNADPGAVVFDAFEAAKNRQADILLIDTAGRLQNKTDLMQELDKIKRILAKKDLTAPHETLLTIDATVGQNGLDQAELFNQFTPLSGIILAKFDGTAKGGIIIAIQKKLQIPVLWVGNGEQLKDLIPFEADTYIEELLE